MWAKDYQGQVTGIKQPMWAVLMISSELHAYYLDPDSSQIDYSNIAINITGSEIIEILHNIHSTA